MTCYCEIRTCITWKCINKIRVTIMCICNLFNLKVEPYNSEFYFDCSFSKSNIQLTSQKALNDIILLYLLSSQSNFDLLNPILVNEWKRNYFLKIFYTA